MSFTVSVSGGVATFDITGSIPWNMAEISWGGSGPEGSSDVVNLDENGNGSKSVVFTQNGSYGAQYIVWGAEFPIDSGSTSFEISGLAAPASATASLGNPYVIESAPIGSVISGFNSSYGPGSDYTWSFVSGTGDTDNGKFSIDQSSLKLATLLDYETQNRTLSIRVSGAHTNGVTTVAPTVMEVYLTNYPEAPADILLSTTSILENNANNAVVANITKQGGSNNITYSLPTYGDNAFFNISGTSLRASASFNYEAKASYAIRIRGADVGGEGREKNFTISISNVAEAPTDIALSSSTLREGEPVGTAVGLLTSIGGVAPFTYAITGGDDAVSFQIDGDVLKASVSADFQTKPSYSVQVTATNGESFSKLFEITVTEAPAISETTTAGSVTVVTVTENPATAGISSPVNAIAKLANGARYIKTGSADNAWDLVPASINVGSEKLKTTYSGLAKLRG